MSRFRPTLAAVAGLLLLVPTLAFAQAARERSDVDDKYKWNLEDIYATDEAWETDFERMKQVADDLAGLREKLGDLDSAKKLVELRHTQEEAMLLFERLLVYAALKSDEDTRVSKYQGYSQQLQTLGVQIQAELAWVDPALVAIPQKKVLGWMEKNEDLALYRHSFDDLWRQQAHVLSEEEERILSLAGDMSSTPRSVYGQMMNADLSFGTYLDENGDEVEMTEARYGSAMRNPNRDVRARAWSVYYDGYERYLHSATAAYAGAVKRDLFYTTARGYESCAQRALDADNVPVEVLENLIAVVSDNLEPIRRYNEIRMRVMDMDTLRHWDEYIPLVPSLDEEIPYEQAIETILTGLQPLGETYVTDMRTGFNSRWVDVYENVGKQSGAYSWGAYSTHPYMLMNYESKLDDMFTLAHEMGHSMHTFYSNAGQPQVYADYPIFLAEVASTTNEAILMDDMLRNETDREKRIFLLNHWIDQIQGTMYTQVMFSEFEKRAHEMAEAGEPLTVDALKELYLELISKYAGGVTQYTDRSGGGWIRIGHFYRNFYVYKYATSYAAATALAKRILDGEPGARDAYLEFLASGSSDYPIELLKKAGVDLSSPEPIQATCDLLAQLVEELDLLLSQT
ncbi:MAG TPA: oligoendopeptidase F [bacterium]|nr:oligoendopeptidase F [bacterium]